LYNIVDKNDEIQGKKISISYKKELRMRWVTLGFIILWFSIGLSDQFATTSDGRKVVLKDNGTWEYVTEEASKEDNYDFRKTNWGMSKEQIKLIEKDTIVKEDERSLAYNGKVKSYPCFVLYIFADNKLVRAKYIFYQEHTNKNDYIVDYGDLKEVLTSKYGKAKLEKTVWKNDLYKDDYQHWGMAISVGHLVYFSSWETPKTEIWLNLSGENYQINLQIEYTSKALKDLEKKVQEQQNKNDL